MGLSDDLDLMQELLNSEQQDDHISVLEELNEELEVNSQTTVTEEEQKHSNPVTIETRDLKEEEEKINNKFNSIYDDLSGVINLNENKTKTKPIVIKKKKKITFTRENKETNQVNDPTIKETIKQNNELTETADAVAIEEILKRIKEKKEEAIKQDKQKEQDDLSWEAFKNLEEISRELESYDSKIEFYDTSNVNIARSNNNNQVIEQENENLISETSEEELFIESGSSLEFKEEWLETYRKALKSKKNNHISEKMKRGKFRITHDHKTEILPDVKFNSLEELANSRRKVV